MTENEINERVKQWLLLSGYSYKGVLNIKPKRHANQNGYGQIPCPDGTRQVLIDHQGVKDRPIDLIWIEAKGSGVGMSMLLQGFSRVGYAVYHGGGKGLLACPTAEFEMMFTQRDFLKAIGLACDRTLGLLDGETYDVCWLS
jgi:hypothetical protein